MTTSEPSESNKYEWEKTKNCLLRRGRNFSNLPCYGRTCMQPKHESECLFSKIYRHIPRNIAYSWLFPTCRNFHRFFYGACSPIAGYGLLTLWGFRDHTRRHTTVSRTPLDEWSARRRDPYLTTHNTPNRQTSMPPAGFEPTISAGERPQTYASDRAATGTGDLHHYSPTISRPKQPHSRDSNFIN